MILLGYKRQLERREANVLLPEGHVILPFPNEQTGYTVFLGVEVEEVEELRELEAYHSYVLIAYEDGKANVYVPDASGMPVRAKTLKDVSIHDARLNLASLVLSRIRNEKLIGLRKQGTVKFKKVEFGDNVIKSNVARIYAVPKEGFLVIIIKDFETLYVDVLGSVLLPYGLWNAIGKDSEDKVLSLNLSTNTLNWNYNFRTFFAVEVSTNRKFVSALATDVLERPLTDEAKERLAAFYKKKDLQKAYEALMGCKNGYGETCNDDPVQEIIREGYEPRGVLAALNVLGGIYGSETLKRITEALDKRSFVTNSQLILKCGAAGLAVYFAINLIDSLFSWFVVPVEIREGRLIRLALYNPWLKATVTVGRDGVITYDVEESLLPELLTERVFLDGENLAEKIARWLTERELFERTERELGRTLLFNIIETLEDVKLNGHKIVQAKVEFSTRNLQKAWEEYKRRRDEGLAVHDNLAGVLSAIDKAKRREESEFKRFAKEAIGRVGKSKLVLDLLITRIYSFVTRFY